jgi:hypothetical protein
MEDILIAQPMDETSANAAALQNERFAKGKLARSFSGEKELTAHLPIDIIGGSIPAIAGFEEEAVWNAASQACGTDRVHFVYTVSEGRCWYLAVPSGALASHPDTWCPLAAALPGNSEYWDRESVYIYEQDGVAAGIRWEDGTGRMQVYAGPSRIILPRLQSLDANFLALNPEKAEPVPWINVSLAAERLSRRTVKWLFWSGMVTAIFCLGLWIMTHLIVSFLRPNVDILKNETVQSTEKLMLEAARLTRNDTDRHIVRIQELLGELQSLGGTLIRYEVKDKKIEWEALIPSASGGSNLARLQAQAVGTESDGRVRIQGTN